MNSFIVYLGYFYIVIGTLFLLVPIIYIELGRPKDLIKAFLNLLIGFVLIIKNKIIDDLFFLIFLINVTSCFLFSGAFLFRWNQLTDNENKLTTFLEFKNNLLKILEAINLGVGNLTKSLNFFKVDSNKLKINSKSGLEMIKMII